jgi:hypothetical protein
MISQKLLVELGGILERQLGRKPTPAEVSEHGRQLVEYFELARKINLTMPKPMFCFKKFNSTEELIKEMYGKINNNF